MVQTDDSVAPSLHKVDPVRKTMLVLGDIVLDVYSTGWRNCDQVTIQVQVISTLNTQARWVPSGFINLFGKRRPLVPTIRYSLFYCDVLILNSKISANERVQQFSFLHLGAHQDPTGYSVRYETSDLRTESSIRLYVHIEIKKRRMTEIEQVADLNLPTATPVTIFPRCQELLALQRALSKK